MRILTENHGWWLDNRGHKHTEWSAIDGDEYDGADDARSPMGHGSTKDEAIADLLLQVAEQVTRALQRLLGKGA